MHTTGGKDCVKSRLSLCGLGVAFGVTWGLGLFVLGLLSTYLGWATPWVELFSSIYIGFASTFIGSLIGGAWGLLDGFITGVIVAFIYNLCVKCCGCSSCKASRTE